MQQLDQSTRRKLYHVLDFLKSNRLYRARRPGAETGDCYIRELGWETSSEAWDRQQHNIATLNIVLESYGWHLCYVLNRQGVKVGVSFEELPTLFPVPTEHMDEQQKNDPVYRRVYEMCALFVLLGCYAGIRTDWEKMTEEDWKRVDWHVQQRIGK
jgi:hypothetical protein